MTKKTLPITIVLIIGVVLVVVLGCSPCTEFFKTFQKKSKEATTGTVKGQVVKPGDGPLAGAKVTIDGKSTTTDAQGNFAITGVTPGTATITITSDDYQYTDNITVGAGTTTLPPITVQSTYPTSAEDVIKAFYKAINDHDYEKAATYATETFTVDRIKQQFEPYIKSVSVTEIIRRPQWDYQGQPMYEVHFDADYIQHYPAGSGDLQQFHTLKQDEAGHWKISGMGTGP